VRSGVAVLSRASLCGREGGGFGCPFKAVAEDLNPAATVRIRELFKTYQEWCGENNEHASNERFFGIRLKETGVAQKRYNDGRYWQGIMVRAGSG
jgi:hypothetical protein